MRSLSVRMRSGILLLPDVKRQSNNNMKSTLRSHFSLAMALSTILATGIFSLTLNAAPKPDPAGVQLIAERWGLPSHEIIVIGDYLFDLQAGRRAGMRSVLFAPGECPPFASEADFVLRDFRNAVELLNALHASDE